MDESLKNRENLSREALASLRAEYLAERHQVTKDRYSAAQDFDKALLTLSASALAFSMALLRFVGGNAEAPWLLLVSWFLFAGSVIGTVTALFFSYHAFDQEVRNVDTKYRIDGTTILQAFNIPDDRFVIESPSDPVAGWAAVVLALKRRFYGWIEIVNVIALACFALGMALLVIFGSINL